MTDLLARPAGGAPQGADPPPEPRLAPQPGALAFGPLVLASLSAAAGIIHLVMAPSHLAESTAEGAGFLVAGWVQIGLAVALIRSSPPRRPLLGAVAAVNAALVALWAVSRTAGLPGVGVARGPRRLGHPGGRHRGGVRDGPGAGRAGAAVAARGRGRRPGGQDRGAGRAAGGDGADHGGDRLALGPRPRPGRARHPRHGPRPRHRRPRRRQGPVAAPERPRPRRRGPGRAGRRHAGPAGRASWP